MSKLVLEKAEEPEIKLPTSGLDGTALSFLQSKGMYWLSLNIPAYLYCRGLW